MVVACIIVTNYVNQLTIVSYIIKQMQNCLYTKLNNHQSEKYATKGYNIVTAKDEILQLLSLKKCIYEYQNTVDQIRQIPSIEQYNAIRQSINQNEQYRKQRRKVQPKKTIQAKLEQKKKVQSQRFLRKREVIENQKQELLRGCSQPIYKKERCRLESNNTKLKAACNSIQFNTTSTKKSQALIHKKARTLSNCNKTKEQTLLEKRNVEMRLKSFIGNYRSKYRCEAAKLREGDKQHKKIEDIVNLLTKQQRIDSNQDDNFEAQQNKAKESVTIVFKNGSLQVKMTNYSRKKPVRQQNLKKGGLLKQRYEIVQKIGKGLSGEVYKGRDILSQKFVAIKVIENHEKKERQYQFYKKVQHKNIVNYLNNFIQNGKRYLVLQYFPQTLQSILKKRKLEQTELKKVFKHVSSALMYLHGLSIAHRDIKLENIVCSEDFSVVKFIDFGLCIDLNEQSGELSKQFCGTVHYMPPEILQLKPYHPKKADIWSLGVLLYKLSFDRFPYRGKDQRQILQKIHRTKLVFPSYCNLDLKDLLQSMLEKSASERASISEVVQHRWLL